MRRLAALLLCAVPLAATLAVDAHAAEQSWVRVPGGSFRSALKYEDAPITRVTTFDLQKRPVTNGDFLAFVKTHPEWQRDQVPTVFAEPRYLSQWAGPATLGTTALPDQPVVQVSWFAAAAYCKAKGARLPIWSEWEYAAAADETRRDARTDPVWRERILGWYARPSNTALPRAGLQTPNVYGVQDLHGLVWEWAQDYSSLMIASDNRNQGDADRLKFCGAGALSMNDRENYAVLMRVAMLSSLDGSDTTVNLGFRCARDVK